MKPVSRKLAAAVLAGLVGFAPVALAYTPVGEIQSAESSASFDATQVVGPRVTMSRQSQEGGARWVGRLKGVVVDATEVKNGLRGAGVNLFLERDKDSYVVRGNLGATTVHVRVPQDPVERFHLRWTLKGEADASSAPAPQLILATIAALD